MSRDDQYQSNGGSLRVHRHNGDVEIACGANSFMVVGPANLYDIKFAIKTELAQNLSTEMTKHLTSSVAFYGPRTKDLIKDAREASDTLDAIYRKLEMIKSIDSASIHPTKLAPVSVISSGYPKAASCIILFKETTKPADGKKQSLYMAQIMKGDVQIIKVPEDTVKAVAMEVSGKAYLPMVRVQPTTERHLDKSRGTA